MAIEKEIKKYPEEEFCIEEKCPSAIYIVEQRAKRTYNSQSNKKSIGKNISDRIENNCEKCLVTKYVRYKSG